MTCVSFACMRACTWAGMCVCMLYVCRYACKGKHTHTRKQTCMHASIQNIPVASLPQWMGGKHPGIKTFDYIQQLVSVGSWRNNKHVIYIQ